MSWSFGVNVAVRVGPLSEPFGATDQVLLLLLNPLNMIPGVNEIKGTQRGVSGLEQGFVEDANRGR